MHRLAIVVAAFLTPSSAATQDQIPTRDAVANSIAQTEFSPYAGRDYPTDVFWGETHYHTEVSVDAGTMTRVSQEDAFRFFIVFAALVHINGQIPLANQFVELRIGIPLVIGG